jgi:hypothetical protein
MSRWPAVAPAKNLTRAIVASTLLWVLGGMLGLVLLSVASAGYRIVPVLFVVIAFIGLVLALTTLLLKVSATQSRT